MGWLAVQRRFLTIQQFNSNQVCNGHELEANHKRASETAASVTCGVVAEVAAYGTGTIGQAGRRSKDVLLPLFLVNPRASAACLVSELASLECSTTLPGMVRNHEGC